MIHPQKVERWRPAAIAEIQRQRLPFPPEMILAVIRAESGGDPTALSSAGAMGLMQVMPITLRDYNQRNGTNYTAENFKSSPPLQIKVGVWTLKSFWRAAYRYLAARTSQIGVDLLSKAASLFYVFGPGRAREYWDKTNPTYEAFASRYASTSPIKNGYATKIWSWASSGQWDADAVNKWLGADGGTDDDTDTDTDTDQNNTQKNKLGALVAIAIMVLAYQYFAKGR